jgi:hypothetical protein
LIARRMNRPIMNRETIMNTTVTTRIGTLLNRLSIAATLALAAAPGIADERSDAAMNSCINLFVAATLPKEQPFVVRQKETPPGPEQDAAAPRRAERIMLTARGSVSGRQIAKATCSVDRDGQVIALNGKSVTAAQIAEAATAREQTAAR